MDTAVTKARTMLTLMQRTFERLAPEFFLPVYSALYCQTLKYCIQIWSLTSIRGIDVIKQVHGFMCLAYSEHMRKLISLRRRRVRGNFIETFQIHKQLSTSTPAEFVTFCASRNLHKSPFTSLSHNYSQAFAKGPLQ